MQHEEDHKRADHDGEQQARRRVEEMIEHGHIGELDVRVPTATKANEAQPYVGQVVINITANGSVIVNRQQKNPPELLELLKKLSQLYPDQAVIVRGDQAVDYKHIVDVLDICRQADIWNVAFATGKIDR